MICCEKYSTFKFIDGEVVMVLTVEQLDKIFLRVVSHLREKDIQEVRLNYDYYWVIDSEEKYEVYNEPNAMYLGQASDDLMELIRYCDDGVDLDSLTIKRLIRVLDVASDSNSEIFWL